VSKSNHLEDELLNYVLRGVAFTVLTAATTPASLHVALFTADPTDAGTGAEVAYTGYARQPVTRGTAVWAAPADNAGSQRTSNSNVITFPASTGGSPTVTHWGLVNALSGAFTLFYHGVLTVAQTINAGGSAPSFAVGALTIQEG